MIQWSLSKFCSRHSWIELKQLQAFNRVKEFGRESILDGVKNGTLSGERLSIYNDIEAFEQECIKLNLTTTCHRILELKLQLGDTKSEFHWSGLESGLYGVLLATNIDLESLTFVFVPLDKATLFEKDGENALYGSDVFKNFQSARAEIMAAGTCMALELHTAAVFHLTRAAEVGLLALSKDLGINKVDGTDIKLAQWGQIINTIDKEILAKIATLGGKRTKEKLERVQFYQGVASEFREIKILWRDRVAHGATYSEHKTMDAYVHVKGLMTRLASRLKE